MSSFDENIAELRGITDNEQNNNGDIQQSSTAASSKAQADVPNSNSRTDPERQPLLDHTTSSSSVAPVDTHLVDHSIDTAIAVVDEETFPSNSLFDNMSGSMFFTLSTIYGATSVALGAFGAHGLKKRIADPGRVANWSTAAQYQLVHSLALLATSIALPQRAQRIPGMLFLTGMTLFSGSIYLLVLDPARFKFLGPVTPIGGLCLIGGWISLGVVGRRFVR